MSFATTIKLDFELGAVVVIMQPTAPQKCISGAINGPERVRSQYRQQKCALITPDAPLSQPGIFLAIKFSSQFVFPHLKSMRHSLRDNPRSNPGKNPIFTEGHMSQFRIKAMTEPTTCSFKHLRDKTWPLFTLQGPTRTISALLGTAWVVLLAVLGCITKKVQLLPIHTTVQVYEISRYVY